MLSQGARRRRRSARRLSRVRSPGLAIAALPELRRREGHQGAARPALAFDLAQHLFDRRLRPRSGSHTSGPAATRARRSESPVGGSRGVSSEKMGRSASKRWQCKTKSSRIEKQHVEVGFEGKRPRSSAKAAWTVSGSG